MGKGIQAIIFDMFGTLVRSGNPEAEIKKAFGLKCRYKDIEKAFCGKTPPEINEEYIECLMERFGMTETEENAKQLQALLEKELDFVEPFPDAEPVLSRLKAEGLKLGLVSNSWAPAISKIGREFGLLGFFDATNLSNETELFKPEPKAFEICLELLGVKAKEALMVGDSLKHDIIGGNKIGLRGILLDRAGKKPESKEPLSIIPNLNELPKAIKQAMQ